jgi:anti-sigma regulatory factor (Ser/Thr protein kinase)
MNFGTALQQAWRNNWRLIKDRQDPWWARVLVMALLSVSIALLTLMLKGWGLDPQVWPRILLQNLIITTSICVTIMAAYRGLELWLSEATMARLNADRSWRSVLLHSAFVAPWVLLGGAMGLTLLGWILRLDAWGFIGRHPGTLLEFGVISVIITALSSLWWWLHMQNQARRLRATEAQLKLLQAQIEPHFLFNTLATVHSLMDHDAARAKRMLESFTDYLRASLGQLRSADATLAAELGMADSYLQLMQTRMDERLRFAIEAEPAAQSALLPPLLLQPLVENAIHHGLEPKLDGGTVRIRARLAGPLLRIEIEDDGLGLQATPRPRSKGAGLALANIRARLHARHGDTAALRLEAVAAGGTLVTLTLPFITKP